jgi:peptide deformylase
MDRQWLESVCEFSCTAAILAPLPGPWAEQGQPPWAHPHVDTWKTSTLIKARLQRRLDGNMTRLKILHHPDPRLRTKATPVDTFDSQLAEFAENMLETMYAAPGIGLAATQVNVHKRVIVVDVSDTKSEAYTLINPVLEPFGAKIQGEEGCLSVPEIYESVERFEQVNVTAQDVNGEPIEFTASGMLAICIQHECDHLEGRLFVDYLSSLKRNRINKKLRERSETLV